MEGPATPTAPSTPTGPSTPSAASREARRRRIVERGSDRLALISGRIKALPSESEYESPRTGSDFPRGHSHTESCPPSITNTDFPVVDTLSISQVPDSLQNEDTAPVSLITNKRSVHETNEKIMSRSLLGPYMCKSEISSEASRAANIVCDSKGQASQVVPTIQSPIISTSDKSHHSEPQFRQTRNITCGQVSAAFTATESVRLHCSLVVAISVILSYIGFPILGSRFLGSAILFRPLLLLLLTNITIALAQLSEKQQGPQKPEQGTNGVPSVGRKGLADQVGSVLDMGLMLQNVIGGLMMDCSVYVIIVICGLSLARTLGF